MKILFTLTFLFFAINCHAADIKGNYAIWGLGIKSCFSYNKARESNEDAAYHEYLKGYLTAYNTISSETYSISGNKKLAEVIAWIDDYCNEKAVHSFEQALSEFIIQHHDKRYRTPPNRRAK